MKFLRLLLIAAAATIVVCARAKAAADAAAEGGPFFLHLGGIYISAFSDITVLGDNEGDVILLFSRLTVKDGPFNNKIYGFSSEIYAPPEYIDKIEYYPLLWTGVFESSGAAGNYNYRGHIVPDFVVKLGLAIFRASCVLLLFAARRAFFEQGFCAVMNEAPAVVKAGLTFYFFCAALVVIFMLSVFLLPVSLLILLITAAVTITGETSAAQYIGFLAAGTFDLEFSDPSFGCLAAGLVVIETACLIPYASEIVMFFVMPVIASGAVYVSLLNATVHKKFYYLPFKTASGGV